MKKNIKMNTDRCKGCYYCIKACPKNALTISSKAINEKGYAYPELDEENCIVCGVCYNVCPDYVFSIEEEGGENNG